MAKKKPTLAEKLKEQLAHKEEVVWTPCPEILLEGNIPEPMHGTNPRTLMGSAWWNETRSEAYRSTDQHCIACQVNRYSAPRDRLEAHELYDVDWLMGLMTYLKTVPVCTPCHNYIHSGRLCALLESGEITQEKYDLVVHHGDRVLRQAGLPVKDFLHTAIVNKYAIAPPWEMWRLVIGKKKFRPHFKSRKAWEQAFDKGKKND